MFVMVIARSRFRAQNRFRNRIGSGLVFSKIPSSGSTFREREVVEGEDARKIT